VSFIAPIAAQASDVINLDGIDSYSGSKKSSARFDSNTFVNEINEDIANLNGRVDGLEAQQRNFEAGSFSDTTSLSGKAVFVVGAIDHPETDAEATDGIENESLQAQYQYTMDLNTSFTGDDNLYVRLRTGNGEDGAEPFGETKYGTYLVSNSDKYSDQLAVDKIWYQFPVGERNTIWVGPKIENYYMHATAPSIYKPITKQFTLGGNGAAYGASTKTGAGWAYKADNGFAFSSNVVSEGQTQKGFVTAESATSWANQIGYTTDNYSASLMVNLKYNGWADSYFSTASGKLRSNSANSTNYGLRGWWRPDGAGTATPSISLGYDFSTIDGAAATVDETDAWFIGLNWTDTINADDKIGIAFGQPQTREDETVEPFAWEAYYEYKVNDSVTVTPSVFGATDRDGSVGGDVTGALVQTTFKF
jgi:hypothetical protein